MHTGSVRNRIHLRSARMYGPVPETGVLAQR